jgi:hypothetical protein
MRSFTTAKSEGYGNVSDNEHLSMSGKGKKYPEDIGTKSKGYGSTTPYYSMELEKNQPRISETRKRKLMSAMLQKSKR